MKFVFVMKAHQNISKKSSVDDTFAISTFFFLCSTAPLKCYYCKGTKAECSAEKLSSNNQTQQVCSIENARCIWSHVNFNRSQEMVYMNCTTPSICDNIKKNCTEFESTSKTGCCDGVCCDSDLCNKGRICPQLTNIPLLLYVPKRRGARENQTSGFRYEVKGVGDTCVSYRVASLDA